MSPLNVNIEISYESKDEVNFTKIEITEQVPDIEVEKLPDPPKLEKKASIVTNRKISYVKLMEERACDFTSEHKGLMWQLLEMGYTNFETNAALVIIGWKLDDLIDMLEV